jgi:uncharacterized membrane protein YagU involved in acid resistance
MKAVFAILSLVGLFVMGFSLVFGVVYCFYLFGVVDIAFGAAAWAGIVLWLKTLVGGFVMYIASVFGMDHFK